MCSLTSFSLDSDHLPEETKFPIILPKSHIFTKLIVKYHHKEEGHEMGVNFTLNHLREKYFVVQGRQQIKRCITECAECNRRFRGCPAQPQMAPFPRITLEMTRRPFANRLRLIYQYSNMAPRLSGQNCNLF